MPLLDSSTMAWLGARRNLYGRIRLWGAIGWGVSAPLIGWFIEGSGVQWAFYGYMVLMSVGLFVALALPMQSSSAAQPFWIGLRALSQKQSVAAVSDRSLHQRHVHGHVEQLSLRLYGRAGCEQNDDGALIDVCNN